MTSAAAEPEWEWPEEPTLSPYYVQNRVVPGEAPAPTPAPVRLPTRSAATDAAAARPAVSMISDYSWSDDESVVKVYVCVRDLRKDGVRLEVSDDSVTLTIALEDGVRHVLELKK